MNSDILSLKIQIFKAYTIKKNVASSKKSSTNAAAPHRRSMSCSLNKRNTRLHFTLDILLYKILYSHWIAMSAAKLKKKIVIETLEEGYDRKPIEQQPGQVG